MENDLLYKIALTKIPLIGPINAKNLISFCGGVEAIFKSTKKELLKVPGIGEHLATNIVKQDVFSIAEKEIEFITKNNIQTFFYLDKNYPQRLRHYDDSPILLYHNGNAEFNHPRTVAIVGTRKPTARGRLICEELVEGLQKYDVQIISGLAFGIDITAHKKCVQLDIPTVGVLGHGLTTVYPHDHRSVANQMTSNGGLLTEFTSDTKIDPRHFPMRNRIIAGLCDALIVVETAQSGGSMISANIANTYNKDVFAVPGRLGDKYSAGCLRLIKSHKAALIESAKDIGYVMRWEEIDQQKDVQTQLFVELSEKEQSIINLLREKDNYSIDQLSYTSKLPSSEMAGLLLALEFKGIIQPLPGKRYMLV